MSPPASSPPPPLPRWFPPPPLSRFDFAFIDALKTDYAAYYEKCLTLMRPGGVIAIDNSLLGGRVYAKDNSGWSADEQVLFELETLMFHR